MFTPTSWLLPQDGTSRSCWKRGLADSSPAAGTSSAAAVREKRDSMIYLGRVVTDLVEFRGPGTLLREVPSWGSSQEVGVNIHFPDCGQGVPACQGGSRHSGMARVATEN